MMGFLPGWLTGRKRRPRFTKQEVLGAVPVRNTLVEWELNEDEEVVLRIPRRQDRVGRMLSRVFAAPDFKQVVLDELGSDVWQLCTGTNSVDVIVREVAKKYKLNRREVELSLSNFLRTLAQRGLVGLQLPASAPESAPAPVKAVRKPLKRSQSLQKEARRRG